MCEPRNKHNIDNCYHFQLPLFPLSPSGSCVDISNSCGMGTLIQPTHCRRESHLISLFDLLFLGSHLVRSSSLLVDCVPCEEVEQECRKVHPRALGHQITCIATSSLMDLHFFPNTIAVKVANNLLCCSKHY